MTLVMAVTIGALYAAGVYLLLQRTLTRIVLGLALMGNGANLLLLMAGGAPGHPPLIGDAAPPGAFADPLPQALALTAIVITFGVIAFLLALAHRSWTVTHDDTVEDDLEDRLIAAGRKHTVHDLEDPLERDPSGGPGPAPSTEPPPGGGGGGEA